MNTNYLEVKEFLESIAITAKMIGYRVNSLDHKTHTGYSFRSGNKIIRIIHFNSNRIKIMKNVKTKLDHGKSMSQKEKINTLKELLESL